jgi:hypothetical protein
MVVSLERMVGKAGQAGKLVVELEQKRSGKKLG